jgi:hypothetical protein
LMRVLLFKLAEPRCWGGGDGGHGRYADEAGAAGPADAAPRAAADGAPPPRTNRPREGQFLYTLSPCSRCQSSKF